MLSITRDFEDAARYFLNDFFPIDLEDFEDAARYFLNDFFPIDLEDF